MNIGEILGALQYIKEDTIIKNIDLNDYGSDRGDYYDFYIGSNAHEDSIITVKELKEFLTDKVIGHSFKGYKGGDYEMDEYVYIRLGCHGCSGSPIMGIILKEDGAYIKEEKILYY